MRRAVLEGLRRVRVEAVAPVGDAGEDCLVRLEAAAVCNLDARVFAGQPTRLSLDQPPVLGHELCGRVVHAGTLGPPAGTRVAVIGSWFCRECDACRRGAPLECATFRIATGGFADELVVPASWCAWRLTPVAEDVPGHVAAYLDTVACAQRAVTVARVTAGDRVCVSGGGFMSAFIARLVQRIPGASIFVVTDGPRRRRTLEALGVACVDRADALGPDHGATVAIDLSASPSFTDYCEAHLAPGGRAVVMSARGDGAFPFRLVYERRVSLLHSFHSDLPDREAASRVLPEMAPVVDAMSRGWPFEEIGEALGCVAERVVARGHVSMT